MNSVSLGKARRVGGAASQKSVDQSSRSKARAIACGVTGGIPEWLDLETMFAAAFPQDCRRRLAARRARRLDFDRQLRWPADRLRPSEPDGQLGHDLMKSGLATMGRIVEVEVAQPPVV